VEKPPPQDKSAASNEHLDKAWQPELGSVCQRTHRLVTSIPRVPLHTTSDMADNGTGQTGPRGSIHEPLSPPSYQASPTNQGPYALLTAVILITITGLTLMIKFRTVAATFRRPRRDDIALAAALVWPTPLCADFTCSHPKGLRAWIYHRHLSSSESWTWTGCKRVDDA